MADLGAVQARLREILVPYGDELVITKDGPDGMTLEVPGLEGKPWGYVAGTRLGKNYVSVYLMPSYAAHALGATISPALQKRRQGKSCFNFAAIDEALFTELGELAGMIIPGYRAEAERVAAERMAGTRR